MEPPESTTLAGKAFRKSLQATVGLPSFAAGALFGEPPSNQRGAPLDRATHILLTSMARSGSPNLAGMEPPKARSIYRRASQLFDLELASLFSIETRRIPSSGGALQAKIFRPHRRTNENGPAPATLFFHGGGFVIGCTPSYDGFLSIMAHHSDQVVISVDYRLAPETPFPGAIDDGLTAYSWLLENAESLGVDPEALTLCGDSAGANLAAVICQERILADSSLPSRLFLIYPRTDATRAYPSEEEFARGYYLTAELIEWFTACYLPDDALAEDPRVSPLFFPHLDRLPPTTIVTAGFDPLRDEGEAYARALRDAGVLVRECPFDHLVHGFISMGGVLPAARRAVLDLANELRSPIS